MTLASVWCAIASSYNSLIAARIFQAIGGAAADTVAPALLGDIYFVDERGRALAVYTIFLCTGPLVGGIAGGYIGFDLGWDYIFWICTGLSGACFVASMLFVPETLYSRIAPTDSNGQSDNISVKETTATRLENADPESYPSYTIARTLALHRPRGKLLPQFLRPWLTLKFPAVWVVMLHYAGLVGGVAAISVVGIQLVASPPYLWGANAGLLQIGALIGSLLALLYTYISSDSGLKRRAKHETNGLAEAEDRLPAMFPCLAIATAGFLVFGFCGQHPSQHGWVGLEVGFGMLAFGLMQIPSIGFTYVRKHIPLTVRTAC
ncbi:MFS domain-containing protein [Fusarium keratoplasticum]|nr:MFS domain-containing protein [Fusarium keratoplasticum]